MAVPPGRPGGPLDVRGGTGRKGAGLPPRPTPPGRPGGPLDVRGPVGPKGGTPFPTRPAGGVGRGMPGPGVPGTDPRSQALNQLLVAAAKRGDQGASTQALTDLMNGVDMGRASRVDGIYGDRLNQYVSSGSSLLGGVQAAYKAQQARDAARRARAGGGGGGGGSSSSGSQSTTNPEFLWWQWYKNQMDPTTGSNVGRTGGSAGGRGMV